MTLYIKNELVIPSLEEISQMSAEDLKDVRISLKNEVSFKLGDASIGGPSHATEVAELNRLIKAVEQMLGMSLGGVL